MQHVIGVSMDVVVMSALNSICTSDFSGLDIVLSDTRRVLNVNVLCSGKPDYTPGLSAASSCAERISE